MRDSIGDLRHFEIAITVRDNKIDQEYDNTDPFTTGLEFFSCNPPPRRIVIHYLTFMRGIL